VMTTGGMGTILAMNDAGSRVVTKPDTTLTPAFSPTDTREAAQAKLKAVPPVRADVYDVSSRRALAQLDGHVSSIGEKMSFSHDGNRVASATKDGLVRVWDAESGRLVRAFKAATRIALDGNGRQLAATQDEHAINVWDVASGASVVTLTTANRVGAIAMSRDGTRIAAALAGMTAEAWTIQIWDAKTGRAVAVTSGAGDSSSSLRFSPDSTLVAAG
jgi:WD40 repeat protein